MKFPRPFRSEVEYGASRTRTLQLSTAAEFAEAMGVLQDSVNMTMGLVNRKWTVLVAAEGSKKKRKRPEEENSELSGKKQRKEGNDTREVGEIQETLRKE